MVGLTLLRTLAMIIVLMVLCIVKMVQNNLEATLRSFNGF